MKITEVVKFIYIYLFSAIGLILIVAGSSRLVDLGLRIYVFKQADIFYSTPLYPPESNLTEEELKKREEEMKIAEEINKRADRQRIASGAIAQIIVGLPLFLYHWRLARKISFQ
jgi:predicted Holliday junction resolvase-like endonuclease